MIRSKFAITRLVALPYALLLTLYLLVVGGGSLWLYGQVKTAETELLINKLMVVTKSLAGSLRDTDAMGVARENRSWLIEDVHRLYDKLSSLRNITIKDKQQGYQLHPKLVGGVESAEVVTALAKGAATIYQELNADGGKRFHEESGELFKYSFDVSAPDQPPVYLEFSFDRETLQNDLDQQLSSITHAILLFGIIGFVSIAIALVITIFAIRATRNLESHFQVIYQQAAITESAAQLVHELRNHLSPLRANVKTLLVSPQTLPEIVADIDENIVMLNGNLSSFLDLTRQCKEAFEPIDLQDLVQEAGRVAEPILTAKGLTLEVVASEQLPRPLWRKAAIRDALINLVVNAAQSGQQEGAIRVIISRVDNKIEIAVEDKGRGIARKQLSRIFDAFYTTRNDGNGLGLAIVRKIILSHQGKIHVKSTPGQGTRITFLLPQTLQKVPKWWAKFKKHSQT